ncbi:hypothetical protein N7532_004424 [Penicillium argentinense]|uniref:Uncharacterized protein n=1 Tax=Penicillium argentinense TaxID=1131581 RepID=A0A9W9FPY9_9EURO|nr:uncharacterized protein N7532_004424 [Penicillium argentinense]KAJ5103895.1 hypothetical protein N7532_004424 [Penicillium argentinense]
MDHRDVFTQKVARALYGALVTLRATQPSTMAQVSVKTDSPQKQKAARMDEWSQLPLRGWSDMERWLISMSDQFTIEQPQSLQLPGASGAAYPIPVSPVHSDIHTHSPEVAMEAPGASSVYAWQPREEINIGSPYENHLHPPAMMSSPIYPRHQAAGGSDNMASPAANAEHAPVAMANEDRDEANHPARAEELSKRESSIYF